MRSWGLAAALDPALPLSVRLVGFPSPSPPCPRSVCFSVCRAAVEFCRRFALFTLCIPFCPPPAWPNLNLHNLAPSGRSNCFILSKRPALNSFSPLPPPPQRGKNR